MKQIIHEIELYYSDLLATKSSGFLSTNFRESFLAFTENPDIPKLSFNEGSTCTQSDLTLDEIKKVLAFFRNNKFPGEFYETFLNLICTHVHKDNCQYPTN